MQNSLRGKVAKLALAILPAAALSAGMLTAPASAASNTATVNVAVTAAVQATIGVTYSSGSNIACNVGASITGMVACTSTATLAGNFRSTKNDTGGSSVSITGATITGTGGATIAPTAFQMTCTGGTTGSPTFGGTPGTLATNAALASTAVNCQNWTGEIISAYSLVAALSLDSSQVAADTYPVTGFTATATAN